MGNQQEPWEVQCGNRIVGADGYTRLHTSYHKDGQLQSIVKTVNAMAGLDPERVRSLIDDMSARGCCHSSVVTCLTGLPLCDSCRARACREDADA